jgi:hypothetical protein
MSFQLWKSRSTGSAGNVAAFRGRPGRRFDTVHAEIRVERLQQR